MTRRTTRLLPPKLSSRTASESVERSDDLKIHGFRKNSLNVDAINGGIDPNRRLHLNDEIRRKSKIPGIDKIKFAPVKLKKNYKEVRRDIIDIKIKKFASVSLLTVTLMKVIDSLLSMFQNDSFALTYIFSSPAVQVGISLTLGIVAALYAHQSRA